MDAVKFLMESNRICQSSKFCGSCPMSDCCVDDVEDIKDAIKTVAIVEKWSEEHPVITNRMKFEEVFGCDMDWVITNFEGKTPTITMPSYIFTHEWWDAEYKEKE